jgi:ribonuclease HII
MLLKYFKENCIEIGLDEAGRGCLAGPVVAAAVCFDDKYEMEGIKDSKVLSHATRLELASHIKSNAVDYAIGVISNTEIDKINILKASIKAMHQALSKMKIHADHLIIDGNKFYKYENISHTCIIKGDGKYQSIAAASILAKTFRDQLMTELHQSFPQYHWNKNKGYPTKQHREAIELFGITKYHRKTFNLLPRVNQLKLI